MQCASGCAKLGGVGKPCGMTTAANTHSIDSIWAVHAQGGAHVINIPLQVIIYMSVGILAQAWQLAVVALRSSPWHLS